MMRHNENYFISEPSAIKKMLKKNSTQKLLVSSSWSMQDIAHDKSKSSQFSNTLFAYSPPRLPRFYSAMWCPLTLHHDILSPKNHFTTEKCLILWTEQRNRLYTPATATYTRLNLFHRKRPQQLTRDIWHFNLNASDNLREMTCCTYGLGDVRTGLSSLGGSDVLGHGTPSARRLLL